jgi:hypothetical protein
MSKPRTPQYFPRMKVRGAHRRRIASFQRLAGSFDRLADAFVAFSAVVAALAAVTVVPAEAGEASE